MILQRFRSLIDASNQKAGFTLTEVIVATAIAGILILGIASLTQFSNNGEIRLKARQDFRDTVNLIGLALKNEKTCISNLGTLTFKQTPQNVPGNQIHMLNSSGGPGNKVVAVGDSLNPYSQISKIELVPEHQLGANRWLGSVNIQATMQFQSSIPQTISYSLPLALKYDANGLLIACNSKVTQSGEGIRDAICSIANSGGPIGGYYYNPVSQKCETRFVSACFAGGNTTATCGLGAVQLNPTTRFSCLSDIVDPSPPGLFTRPMPPPFNFAQSSLPRVFQCLPSTVNPLAVTCDYATDANPTGATCYACCIVDLQINPAAASLPKSLNDVD